MREHDRRWAARHAFLVRKPTAQGWPDAEHGRKRRRRAGYLNALGVAFLTRERDAGEVVNRHALERTRAIRELIIELPAHVLDAGIDVPRGQAIVERDQPIRMRVRERV